MLSFPKIGAIVTVPLYPAPEEIEGESEESFAFRQKQFETYKGVTVRVRLLDREYVRDYGYRWARAVAEEEAGLRDADETERRIGFTSEGIKRMADIQRELIEKAVAGVPGVSVGDESLEKMSGSSLVDALDSANLIGLAARAARDAQRPTPKQGESSGS